MANPAFVAQRGKGRDAPEDVYTTKLAKDMDTATNGAVFHPDNSLYELFVDFAQTFTFKQHSMGVVAIRCEHCRPATGFECTESSLLAATLSAAVRLEDSSCVGKLLLSAVCMWR